MSHSLSISSPSQCSTSGVNLNYKRLWNVLCGMFHIKEPLLLTEKNSPCGGSGVSYQPIINHVLITNTGVSLCNIPSIFACFSRKHLYSIRNQ